MQTSNLLDINKPLPNEIMVKGFRLIPIRRGLFYCHVTTPGADIRYTAHEIPTRKLFHELGIDYYDRDEFQRKVLGYGNDGIFPECKTKTDLMKFINALIKKVRVPDNKLI